MKKRDEDLWLPILWVLGVLVIIGTIAMLSGCAFLENIATRPAAPDPRPALGPTDHIRIPKAKTMEFRCADNGPLICNIYGTEADCDCNRHF